MSVLVTGSAGLVGRSVVDQLAKRQTHQVKAASRNGGDALPPQVAAVCMSGLGPHTDHSRELAGASAVLHLAARVHVMHETTRDPLAVFREVNTAGTLNLARQAAAAGVRRFVFVSSIKVNGERTAAHTPFRHDDTPHPEDPYGISKREAEDGLWAIAEHTGMEVVIVRPPLVYGAGVAANFAALMRAVRAGWPLPMGAITHNRRSLVAVDNLADLLITCLDHPAAANQTFLVSDGEDMSMADLLHRLGHAMGRPARLFPVPPAILQAGARLLGQGAMVQRLLGNLQVDIAHTQTTLGWAPPIAVDEGLRRAAARPAAI